MRQGVTNVFRGLFVCAYGGMRNWRQKVIRKSVYLGSGGIFTRLFLGCRWRSFLLCRSGSRRCLRGGPGLGVPPICRAGSLQSRSDHTLLRSDGRCIGSQRPGLDPRKSHVLQYRPPISCLTISYWYINIVG